MNEDNRVVLDASAILAIILQERHEAFLTPEILGKATASTVNIAEVQTSLVRRGLEPEMAWKDALGVAAEVVPFTTNHAKIAGTLTTLTRGLGLSLGDRSCLALAITLNAPVYTADKAWRNLTLSIPIHVIR